MTRAVLGIVLRVLLFLLVLLGLLGLLPLFITVTAGTVDCFRDGFGTLVATVDATADWEADAQ
jgi:hypothetical protein